jgi:5-hydroxyisourate hydrolase-like protein (transthyretin family)
MHSRATLLLLWFPLLAACGGCGNKYHTLAVGGKVVFADGTPAAGVQVTFECQQPAVSATAVSDEQGNFRLGTLNEGDGAPAGKYRVALVEGESDDVDHPPPRRIHSKYGNPETSGLEFTVDQQHTHFEIKLVPAKR